MSVETNAATTSGGAATITVPEAARLLGISKAVAYQLAGRGELPGAMRLGRRFVVSRRALERALGNDEPAAA